MIKVVTINVEGIRVEHSWDDFSDFKDDWEGEDWSGPDIEDRLIDGEVDGEKVSGDLFGDVLDYLSDLYDWEY